MKRPVLDIVARLVLVALSLIGVVGVLRAKRQDRRRWISLPAQESRRGWMRHWVFGALAAVTAGVAVAAVAVVAGLVPIRASSGHWSTTAWFLKFAMRRSVATHTIGLSVPPLDSQLLVVKGATHYDIGCRPCHGSPGARAPRIAEQMTPHPPSLVETARDYDAGELFYIVKHGVKFTGMPAWAARQRDDEVWAVVAFVRRLPGFDAAQYEHLAMGGARLDESRAPIESLVPPAGSAAARRSCQRCHGAAGVERGRGAFPVLDGQRLAYLDATLEAYASGDRHSGIMGPIAAALPPHERRAIARSYADGRRPPAAEQGTAVATGLIAEGADIAARGRPDQDLPPCSRCHGPAADRDNPSFPRLAGQRSAYLALQLRLFQADRRGGTPYAHIMRKIAGRLTEEQMDAVAAYYASLEPERPGGASVRP
ncbi:MAG: c-type cytochrome [Vicinamibacterales bacterium]